MAETLANGTTIPQGTDLIHGSGVQAMRNLGGSVDAQLGTKVGTSDPRLSDARTPTAHTHTITDVAGLAAFTQDTGWRDVSADLLGGATGVMHIRRVGMYVTWRVKNFVAGTSHSFYNPPTGLRATSDAHVYFAGEGTVGQSFYRHMNGRLSRSIYDDQVVQGFWFEGNYVLPPGTPPITVLPGKSI